MKRLQLKRANAAFTLLEIMLVVMIIALLAGSAIYYMRGTVDTAKITRVDGDINAIMSQLQMYEIRNGAYPSSAQGVAALVERPAGEPQPRRWIRLMEQIPLDPWNNVYQIRNPATMSKAKIDLFSMGPDGQPNTADDIGNWQ